jgi:methylphosphotriester-DNA--protein-cysteine methyltransferase
MKTGDETKQMNQLKQILATKSNTTSEAIKNIVFDHYKHFIEASRSVYGNIVNS